MWSLKERYQNDNAFRSLVDMMECQIAKAEFTPSEIRQAALLACINYEAMNVRKMYFHSPKAIQALNVLHEVVEKHGSDL